MSFLVDSVVFGLAAGASYALVAAGLSFLFGVMGAAFMAHGAVFALGAYAMFYLNVGYGLPAPLAILAAGLIAAGLGLVVEAVMHRRLWHDVDLGLVAYVGLLWALEGLMQVLFGPDPKTVPAFVAGQIPLGSATGLSLQRAIILPVTAALVLGLWLLLRYTRFGLHVRAVKSNRESAATLGIDTRLVNGSVFAVSLAMAAVAGALTSPIINVTPTMGFGPLLKSFIIIVLGGMGSFGATIVAAFAFGIVESVCVGQFGSGIGLLLVFTGVAIFLVIRPKGIAGV